jgi:DNA-binding HxlR family transcriptional regulator
MKDETIVCPAYAAIDLFQEKWVLHIVRILLDGPRGFNALSRAVGGCNAATLAQRLGHLEKIGMVRKTVHSVMPPRTTYALTPMGVELQGALEAIDRWARKYLPAAGEGVDVHSAPKRDPSRGRPHAAGRPRRSAGSRV